MKRITADDPGQRIILRAVELGVAVYSPHTALDAAPGGVTDWLCEGVSGGEEGRVAGDCRALTPLLHREPTREVKVVTFAPESAIDGVRAAMATGGAGIIGNYRLCSFSVAGEGTFFGNEEASPMTGETGRLERANERRIEMVCSRDSLALVLQTLREFHPYEEPAIDVYDLEPEPKRAIGAGRRLVLDRAVTVHEIGQRLKSFLDRSRIRYSLVGEDRPFTHIGVVPGSGGSLAPVAREEGCEVFVTGEMTHHDVVAATQGGLSVVLAGHTNTERGYLPHLARRLRDELPELETMVSGRDTDLLKVM